MALFRKMEQRHLICNQSRTTIAMEREFWLAADRHAEAGGLSWREWAMVQLAVKPEEIGRASWLRVSLLKSCCN